MRRASRFPLVATLVASLALALCTTVAGCATTPSADDRKAAAGHYEVALALVHEAEQLGAAGNGTEQDAKYREALRELLDAEKSGGMVSEHHYLIGFVYFVGFRRHADAERHLLQAITLRKGERDEEYPEAENTLGTVLVDAGRAKEALAHFEKARTNLLYATPYYAEQELGWALFKLGRHDEAVQHLQRALVAQPDLCGAYLKLAEVEVARGNDARVQTVLDDFLTRCDSERLRASTGPRLISSAFLQLGKSRLRSGARDGAVDAFKQCLTRFGGEPAGRECDEQLRVLDSGG